ncbi:MAG: hypothetical protein IID37_17075, partial [Planctomycetes bacterium]|nr:hypothetical protein [Planctomycetota bacterium]
GLFCIWTLTWLVVNEQFGWPVVRGVCLVGGLCCIGILPGVIQRLNEHPDLPIRYGVFPVSRWQPIYLGLTMKSMQVVWALSVSGTSPNVIAAVARAREIGATVIGFTGPSGGRLAEYCHHCLRVDHLVTPRVQEVHELAYHLVCHRIEQAFE